MYHLLQEYILGSTAQWSSLWGNWGPLISGEQAGMCPIIHPASLGKLGQVRPGGRSIGMAGCISSWGYTGSLRFGSHTACRLGKHLAGCDTHPHLEYRAVQWKSINICWLATHSLFTVGLGTYFAHKWREWHSPIHCPDLRSNAKPSVQVWKMIKRQFLMLSCISGKLVTPSCTVSHETVDYSLLLNPNIFNNYFCCRGHIKWQTRDLNALF